MFLSKLNGAVVTQRPAVNTVEAVVTEENPSMPAHTVLAILQKGYYLHDRLLRPALVKVAVGGPE